MSCKIKVKEEGHAGGVRGADDDDAEVALVLRSQADVALVLGAQADVVGANAAP